MIFGILIFVVFINISSLALLFVVSNSVQVFIPLFVEYKKDNEIYFIFSILIVILNIHQILRYVKRKFLRDLVKI